MGFNSGFKGLNENPSHENEIPTTIIHSVKRCKYLHNIRPRQNSYESNL